MEKIALIADSTCDLDKEAIEKYDIKMLPLRIIYKDREYLDRIDITPKEVYDGLEKEVPSTSLPSMKDMDEMFENLIADGYTHAIAITISSGLSGTYNSLKLVSENHPGITTTVFDSKFLSMGTGGLVLECGEMIKQNKSYEEIVNAFSHIRSRMSLYFVVDTLEYLKRGGRIGKVSGTIGELLNIKPIISINEEGVYYTYSKVRGKKQAISKMINILKETLANNKCKVWVMSGGGEEEAKKVFDTVKDFDNIVSLGTGDISPVAGVHSGPGLVGLCIMKED